jgi:hypothetical protein
MGAPYFTTLKVAQLRSTIVIPRAQKTFDDFFHQRFGQTLKERIAKLIRMQREMSINPLLEAHTFRRRVGHALCEVFQMAFDICSTKLADDMRFRKWLESLVLSEGEDETSNQ